jgi:gamma-glutamyltranspeptidase
VTVSVSDVTDRGSRPVWKHSIKIELPFNQVLYTAPLPGSGVILGFIMNILSGFLDYSQPTSITNWQKIIESFKYGYGKRTELGDIDINSVSRVVYGGDYLTNRLVDSESHFSGLRSEDPGTDLDQ